ncbi:MAG: dienelactone hydrolase family protein [Vicinamibacterales bacterium]|nr:dienelactone hydrolase family protein [Vicinamibacterales bacterium]
MVVALTLSASPAFAAEAQAVTFAARDGVQISGVLHLPARTPAPAVVLLNMLGRTHRDWDGAAARFVEAGIAVLAVDFRPVALADPDSADGAGGTYGALVLDAEAARAYLAARPEVNPARIGMAGASLGANVAVLAAGNDPSVRSLALLSVSLDYRGLKLEQALKKFASRPALLVASSEDPFALRSARQAVTMGDGPRELRVLAGAGHGSVMLDREPELATALVDWFIRTLL